MNECYSEKLRWNIPTQFLSIKETQHFQTKINLKLIFNLDFVF